MYFYSRYLEGYNHCSSGRTFFWRLRRWSITCWKSNIFIRKNYFVFIIYAQIYLQNFKTFDAVLFFFKFTKITFFQAVKLVVPLKKNWYSLASKLHLYYLSSHNALQYLVFGWIFIWISGSCHGQAFTLVPGNTVSTWCMHRGYQLTMQPVTVYGIQCFGTLPSVRPLYIIAAVMTTREHKSRERVKAKVNDYSN